MRIALRSRGFSTPSPAVWSFLLPLLVFGYSGATSGQLPERSSLASPGNSENTDEMILRLPGNVSLLMTACAPNASPPINHVSTLDCYTNRWPLTYRQWHSMMPSSRLEASHDASSEDAPVPNVSWQDLSGEKGLISALQAYSDKYPSTVFGRPLKFGVIANGEEYRITATVSNGKRVPPVAVESACGFGGASTLSCSQTRTGNLSTSDCTLGDGSYADIYAFQGTSGQTVTLDLTSSSFDAYLLLWDPSGNVAAQDDDGGPGFDSRVTFTLYSSGTWYVAANSLHEGVTGGYSISLSCTGQNECPTTTISCGAQISASLTGSSCQLNDGSYANLYRFSGSSGQTAVVDMTSGAFDTYLILADPDGNVVATDDDGGTGTDSRISYTLTKSGYWGIAANALRPSVTGPYNLRLQCGASTATCSYSLGSHTTSLSATGGSGSVQVTGSPSGCSGGWSAQSNSSWISLTNTASGSGSGTWSVGYSVVANPNTSSRTGTISIAGQNFTISQSGGTTPGCTATNTRACLLNGRFSTTIRYRSAFDNGTPDETAFLKSVTGFSNPSYETAFFYFNNDNNIEIMVKLIDQGNRNSAGQSTIAVLFGSATPLRVELTITDTQRNTTKTYVSSFNSQQGATDFMAFLK